MKTKPHPRRRHAPGAAMLMVLAFTIIGGIGVTAWVYLLATRAIQAGRMGDAVARHLTWGNSAAINQQYAFGYTYQDNVTQVQLSSTVSGGGGVVAASFGSLSAFTSTNNYSNPASSAAPFNNIRKQITADSSVYYTETVAATDSTQNEHLLYYNFQKSYPRSLLGDLLIVYAKPSGAANTYITDNLKVNGRVLVYDSTADVSGVENNECLNMTRTGTNSTKNSSSTATLLPLNFPSIPIFTAGSSGGSTGAVLDGSLNVINNTNFTVNSVSTDLTADSLGYYTLSTSSTSSPLNSGGNINSTTGEGYTNGVADSSGTGDNADDIWVRSQSTPTYTPPSTSPYNYSWSSPLKSTTLLLKSSTLKHINIVSGVNQLILQGQTTSTDYTNAGTLAPLMIWVQQEVRDIRFVGENNRRLILAIGTGTGLTCFMSWSGTNVTGSGALRWRLHLINQYRNLYLDPPSGNNVTLTGGIRTNWTINSTDASATTRFTLNTEASPGTLTTLLPRDAWFEPLVVQ